jgi:multicomponent Na+:H+ antiporter subunit G
MIAEGLILIGAFFILAAAIGVLRFPDLYTRLHASTKLITLGGLGVFIGTAVALNQPEVTTRMLLITAFFFLTAPLSAYMIARAAYLRGLEFFKEEGSADEWGELGAENDMTPVQDLASLKEQS